MGGGPRGPRGHSISRTSSTSELISDFSGSSGSNSGASVKISQGSGSSDDTPTSQGDQNADNNLSTNNNNGEGGNNSSRYLYGGNNNLEHQGGGQLCSSIITNGGNGSLPPYSAISPNNHLVNLTHQHHSHQHYLTQQPQDLSYFGNNENPQSNQNQNPWIRSNHSNSNSSLTYLNNIVTHTTGANAANHVLVSNNNGNGSSNHLETYGKHENSPMKADTVETVALAINDSPPIGVEDHIKKSSFTPEHVSDSSQTFIRS